MIDSKPFKVLLKKKNMTIRTAAILTGIPLSKLQLFSRGKRMNVRILDRLCERLECQPEDLIRFTEEDL